MRNYFIISVVFFLFTACSVEGVKKDNKETEVITSDLKKTDSQNLSLKPSKIINELKLKNGLKIKWFIHGKGEKLHEEDVININYQVFLENGTLVDGNELLNRESLPFLVWY